MPWKGEKNPYFVWLSEIILQQTRVAQGTPYYERFVEAFPTVLSLAHASEDEVMKLWEGLGYYSRARNLHATAKHIAFELKGEFPDTYQTLLTLKGVGPYTAAAIASFAFDLPHAVVDGNVLRVLARYFGISSPIDDTKSKKQFTELANQLIDAVRPADFNQAIMDFGATVCMPANPLCKTCSMSVECVAFKENRVGELPVNNKKIEKKERYFHYFVIHAGEDVFIRKRVGKDIWQHLYEFPMLEVTSLLSGEALIETSFISGPYRTIRVSKPYRQALTHRYIIAIFKEIEVEPDFEPITTEFLRIKKNNLINFAFPKIITLYLQDKELSLFG